MEGQTGAAAPVDAGPLAHYAARGIYGQFRQSYGFFIVRDGDRIFAQSAICTHRDCLLSATNGGFRCRCHGSTFTVDGHVTRGPARRDLPRYALEQQTNGHLLVHLERPLLPHQFDLPVSSLLPARYLGRPVRGTILVPYHFLLQ